VMSSAEPPFTAESRQNSRVPLPNSTSLLHRPEAWEFSRPVA